MAVLVVKLSPESQARSEIFFERNVVHASVNKKVNEFSGELVIRGDEEATVVDTPSVRNNIKSGRLVLVSEEPEADPEPEPEKKSTPKKTARRKSS